MRNRILKGVISNESKVEQESEGDSNEEKTGSKPRVDWRNEESLSGENIS